MKTSIAMVNGQAFKTGKKVYKNSKLCNMMMSRESHSRHHTSTGVVFKTLCPGCVADTALFRDTPQLCQTICPWFQKNITKSCVTQTLAGKRLAQVVADAGFELSGQHQSWGSRQKRGAVAFAQPLPTKATKPTRSVELETVSEQLVGLA